MRRANCFIDRDGCGIDCVAFDEDAASKEGAAPSDACILLAGAKTVKRAAARIDVAIQDLIRQKQKPPGSIV